MEECPPGSQYKNLPVACYHLMSASVVTPELGRTKVRLACLGKPPPAKLGSVCQRNCDSTVSLEAGEGRYSTVGLSLF